MANIATCPKCAKQLGLPTSIAMTDRVECPECHAIFSLSETVQISLPVARVLDPVEQPVFAADELKPTLKPELKKGNVTDALASNTAPLKSWEERLKNALALDDSNEEVAPATKAIETMSPTKDAPKKDVTKNPAAIKTTPKPSPSFEFELDPAPSAVTEPKQKTLDLDLPKPKPRATPTLPPQPGTQQATNPTRTLADFATGELASTGGPPTSPLAELPKPIEKVEVAVQTTARRRATRSGFPKIAAFVAGPVVGSLMGLYGLLWFQGAKADYVGLARVLPASLLPANFGEPSEAASIAETSSPGLMEKLQERPPTIKRDAAVLPASATEPVPPVISTVRINADEFNTLVEAAEVALPEFVAGDLSTPGAIKRKGQAYIALCQLAEHFDFAQQPGLAPAMQTKVEQAKQLFRRAGEQVKIRQDLAHIAGRWWEYDKRPSPGIFLIGEVEEALPTGDGTLCWVKPGGEMTSPAIPVWFTHGRYQAGDQIGVVGSVITNPTDMPPDFTGNQVIEANYDFAL